MSGGHYDYNYFKIDMLADDIEKDFINDGKYVDRDWTSGNPKDEIEYDRIGDASDVERPLILAEIKSLIKDLRTISQRAKELEWYMSGDTGATSYLKRISKNNE